ncbi:MAG: sugar phosphate isomerase/epimerase [Bacteroidetes bacterium]|nr:sugar phosphate isomerase/epimerase [Bacteroidota bacterium]
MNKIGIHYGSFVSTWSEDQFPLIKRAKSIGFDLLEFGVPFLLEMGDYQLQQFKDEAQENDLLLVLSLGLNPEQDIGSPNSEIRNAGMKVMKDTIKAMIKIGAVDCSGIVYGSWNGKISRYEDKAIYWKNSVASMKEIAKILTDEGVYFNLEVVNRFENFLLNTCGEALKYIEEVGSSHIGVHLDTFHMNIEEDSMVAPIIRAGDKLRYFHVGENNRKFPGLGNLSWKTIFDSLKAINYFGPITMEPFVKPGSEVGSAVSLFRNLMDTSDYENDMRQSLSFVRHMLL